MEQKSKNKNVDKNTGEMDNNRAESVLGQTISGKEIDHNIKREAMGRNTKRK